MNSFAFLTAALGFQSIVSAHMLLSYPPAFRYQGNPNVPSGSVDYSLTAPLKADGSDFPCKGYQSDMGSAAGASVATWSAGGTYNFTLGGDAPHGGGSCQAALSYDKGKTFTVIHSYVGGCPIVTPAGGSFSFNVPSDAPPGAAMFAWTWFNEIGNREMYMDCASVTITASSGKRAERAERAGKRAGTSFSSRPSLFVANIGNGCTTIEGTDLTFPDPGPDVSDVTKTPGGITGTCKQVAGIGDFASGSANAATSPANAATSSANAATSPAGTSAVASSAAPVASASSSNAVAGTIVTPASSYAAQTSSGSQTVTMSSAAPAASSTGASTSGLALSSDGSCGGSFGCQGSIHGNCCSQWGWCGSTSAYCGTGCQSAFGSCGTSNSSSPGSAALQISTDKTCGPTTSNTCQGSTYGNCCSQYGYCGSTSDYCGTGCQSGFGTCGLASSGNSLSPSSMALSSPLAVASSGVASQAVSYPKTTTETITYTTTMTKAGGAFTAASGSPSASSGFVGVTQPTSQASTFITVVKPTTTATPTSMSSTFTPDLVTIIPTHLRRRNQA